MFTFLLFFFVKLLPKRCQKFLQQHFWRTCWWFPSTFLTTLKIFDWLWQVFVKRISYSFFRVFDSFRSWWMQNWESWLPTKMFQFAWKLLLRMSKWVSIKHWQNDLFRLDLGNVFKYVSANPFINYVIIS